MAWLGKRDNVDMDNPKTAVTVYRPTEREAEESQGIAYIDQDAEREYGPWQP